MQTTLQRRFDLCIPRNKTTRQRSQFPHSCFCERFIYSHDRSTYVEIGEIGNEAAQFHFWVSLFQIIGYSVFAVQDVSLNRVPTER